MLFSSKIILIISVAFLLLGVAFLMLIKNDFKMTEIEKFDYIIIGPSEFALIENGKKN